MKKFELILGSAFVLGFLCISSLVFSQGKSSASKAALDTEYSQGSEIKIGSPASPQMLEIARKSVGN